MKKWLTNLACVGFAMLIGQITMMLYTGKTPSGQPTSFGMSRELKKAESLINSKTPKMVGPDIRLDGVVAGPGLKLTVNYTLTDYHLSKDGAVSSVKSELRQLVKTAGCENKSFQYLLDNHVFVYAEFKDSSGALIDDITVSPVICVVEGPASSVSLAG